jgi:Protein of unknown function (DUF2568)
VTVAVVRAGNLALRFLLELAMLGAFCAWGFANGSDPVGKTLLGLGAPVLAAVLWGTFLSPRAAVRLPTAARVALELLLFGAAVAALTDAGRPGLAVALGVLVLVNEVLIWVLGQRTAPAGGQA